MMIKLFSPLFIFIFCAGLAAQSEVQPVFDADKALARAAEEKGMRAGFLESLSADSVIFRPEAVNGHEYWTKNAEPPSARLIRRLTFGDTSSSGLLGYTTGSWRLYPKENGEALAEFGEYVTIWERGLDGKFRASLDIEIAHDKLSFLETDKTERVDNSRDPNKRGWSPADASMNFLRTSMSRERLGAAYEQFAAKDVRLLIEREAPILGKKRVVSEMQRYISIEFPKKVALFQSADMAYTWNTCQFANTDEGTESGNCLHIWKLRDKKWYIVLGVFARVKSTTAPTLKVRPKRKKPQ